MDDKFGISDGSSILCSDGRLVDPLNFKPGDASIEVIAHSLSQKARWSGMCTRFLPVSVHCQAVSKLCEYRAASDGYKALEVAQFAMAGLLHDASEAYLVDLARPIKYAPGLEAYREYEKRVERAIYDQYINADAGFWIAADRIVKWADNLALVYEADEFVNGGSDLSWVKSLVWDAGYFMRRSGFRYVSEHDWRMSRDGYLDRFNSLVAAGVCSA